VRCSPDQPAQHVQCSDHEHGQVNAHLARLQLAADPAQCPHQAGGSIHRGPIDQALVHLPPQGDSRNRHQRANDDRIVELVDVVLVVEHLPESRVWCRVVGRDDGAADGAPITP